jgi:hypothetical protein
MYCPSCASGRQAEFTAEMNIHFRGLQNLDKPGLLVFPELLVCLDCGFARFPIAGTELAVLVNGTPTSGTSIRNGPLATSRPAGKAALESPPSQQGA